MNFIKNNLMQILAGMAIAAPTGVLTYQQADQRWSREFIVMNIDGHDAMSEALALGDIVREIEGVGYVVKSTKKEVSRVQDANLIVEPIIEYGIPNQASVQSVRPWWKFWAMGDIPDDGITNPEVPSCTCKCECKLPPNNPPPVEPPPNNPPPKEPNPTDPEQGNQKYDYGVKMVQTVPKFNKVPSSGVKVCITDTGIDKNHEDLKHVLGKDFTGDGDYQDGHGHGTHCAGAVAAVNNGLGVVGASQAQLLIAKVLSDEGSGSNEGIASAIKWCVDNGAQVISMSLGGPSPSRVLEYTLLDATRKGVWVFAAAGNDGNGRVGYPAKYNMPGLFSVSAIDQDGNLARFSNYGKIEMTAPGVNTLSTMPGNKYAKMSGTSMATPIAAGVGAMYRAAGKPMVFKDMGNKTKFGAGLPTGEGL